MNISQIYQKYKIMPSLVQHQLRVAAVAKIICENISNKVNINAKSVITACLLHDMGNILKFDLKLFPDFLEPQGLEYWQKVKQEFADRYGKDEHLANLKIAEEIAVNNKILDLINAIGFDHIEKHFRDKGLEKIICEYADSRVAPQGIVPLETRLKDLEKRYGPKYPSAAQKAKRQKFYEIERQSEEYIFENISLKPEDISEEALSDTITRLKLFEIS